MNTEKQIVFINASGYIKRLYMIVIFVESIKALHQKHVQESICFPNTLKTHNAYYICHRENDISYQFIAFNRNLKHRYGAGTAYTKGIFLYARFYMGKIIRMDKMK